MRYYGDKVAHVAVSAGHIVDYRADSFLFRKRKVALAAPQKNVHLSVEVCFNEIQCVVVHLFAEAVYELYTVVLVGVM